VSPELARRLARAFDVGMASWAEQDLLRKAAGPASVRAVEDMPEAAQVLLYDLETRPRPWRPV
jgi:hypothetical protein